MENPNTDNPLEIDLDYLIDEWASDVRDKLQEKGYLDDDFRGMHHTALISIARARQAIAAAEVAHQQFDKQVTTDLDDLAS